MQSSISKYFTRPIAKSEHKPAEGATSGDCIDLCDDSQSEGDCKVGNTVVNIPTTNALATMLLVHNDTRHSNFSAAVTAAFEDRASHKSVTNSGNQELRTKVKYTPLEQQVVDVRKCLADCVLMVECGYRMRFFGSDATIAAKVLSIYAHKDHNFIVASVPTYRTVVHCKRLVAAGYKVGCTVCCNM